MIRVAVGVVVDAEDRILITQRPLHKSHGGYWEFPGGKIEAGELAEQALARELLEEVDIQVHDSVWLGDFVHDYDQLRVHLDVFKISRFSGQALCLEGQGNLAWVRVGELGQYQFPAANYKIIDLINSCS